MTIIQYFLRELYLKIIYLMLIFIILVILVVIKAKIFFLYILEPIKKIKLNHLILNYQNSKINSNILDYIRDSDEIFIPIVEINIPFFTTSYIFIKYIILFTMYLFIPILLYYIYISISNILKKNELLILKYILYSILIFIYVNFIITHYIVVPIYLNFIYSHYTEFLYYEFDVEFQLLTYLDFYFSNLFINFFLFVIIITKKYLNFNINNILILLLLLIIVPFDGTIQLIYIIIYIIFQILTSLIVNYIQSIKKYKQMEYLKKH